MVPKSVLCVFLAALNGHVLELTSGIKASHQYRIKAPHQYRIKAPQQYRI